MISDTFWIKCSKQFEKGNLLLNSEAKLEGNPSIMNVEIYENGILFESMCIQFSFDLKFLIQEGTIKFEVSNKTTKSMIFELPLNDEKLWRNVLRKKINQKGFHEIFKPIKKIGKGSFATVFLVQKLETK